RIWQEGLPVLPWRRLAFFLHDRLPQSLKVFFSVYINEASIVAGFIPAIPVERKTGDQVSASHAQESSIRLSRLMLIMLLWPCKTVSAAVPGCEVIEKASIGLFLPRGERRRDAVE